MASGEFASLRPGLPDPPPRRRRGPIFRFTVQIVTGTALFCLVGAAAVAVSYLVDRAAGLKFVPILVIDILRLVELFIFAADIGSMVVFILVETTQLIRSLLKGET